MSWSVESSYISGYTTGTTGLEILKSLTFVVSGLSYNSTGIDIVQSRWTTGYAIIGSGNISTEVSGDFTYYSDDNYWRADVVVTDQNAPGELATGCFEWYWNTGASAASTGWYSGYIRIFGNSALDAWNVLSAENGSVDNADSQHSHSAYAQNLSDLDDINIPTTDLIDDGDALIWSDSLTAWTTGEGGGAAQLSELSDVRDVTYGSNEYLRSDGTDEYYSSTIQKADVPDYTSISGYAVDWDNNSGNLDDYKSISGQYITHKDDSTIHFEESSISHDNIADVSPNDHHIQTAINDTPTNNETTTGASSNWAYDHENNSTAHHDPSGYETISGDWNDVSGYAVDWNDSSGTLEDYPTVSGDVSTINGDYVKTDASRGITGTMYFTGAIYVGDTLGSNYLKIWMDGSDIRIDAIGGDNTIIVSGNVQVHTSGQKISGAVWM